MGQVAVVASSIKYIEVIRKLCSWPFFGDPRINLLVLPSTVMKFQGLTDKQWDMISTRLPEPGGIVGMSRADDRQTVDACSTCA